MEALYASIDFARQYIRDRHGDADPFLSLTDADTTRHLLLATEHLDLRFGAIWIGRRTQTDQARDWPRSAVVVHGEYLSSTEIPALLRKATVEVAKRSSEGVPLMPDVAASQTGIKRTKYVGDGIGEEEIEYVGSGSNSTAVLMGKVDALLSPLIHSYGAGIGRVVRGG